MAGALDWNSFDRLDQRVEDGGVQQVSGAPLAEAGSQDKSRIIRALAGLVSRKLMAKVSNPNAAGRRKRYEPGSLEAFWGVVESGSGKLSSFVALMRGDLPLTLRLPKPVLPDAETGEVVDSRDARLACALASVACRRRCCGKHREIYCLGNGRVSGACHLLKLTAPPWKMALHIARPRGAPVGLSMHPERPPRGRGWAGIEPCWGDRSAPYQRGAIPDFFWVSTVLGAAKTA